MPEPEIDGIQICEPEGGGWSITYSGWFHGNRRHRAARALAIASNLRRDGWRCEWCGDPVPAYRRADARYCREGCRKAAGREARSDARPGPGNA